MQTKWQGETVENQHCPNCKRLLDCASGMDNKPPKQGDISICFYCGAVNQFGDHLILQELTAEEYESLPKQLKVEVETVKQIVRRANASQ